MTVREWLRTRVPEAPEALRNRVEAAIGPALDEDARSATEVALDAAVRVLSSVLAEPDAGRESAFDLLTVDALVTYAFEAASEQPEGVPSIAARAMARLAVLGALPDAVAAASVRC
jgi:hypothetical protein